MSRNPRVKLESAKERPRSLVTDLGRALPSPSPSLSSRSRSPSCSSAAIPPSCGVAVGVAMSSLAGEEAGVVASIFSSLTGLKRGEVAREGRGFVFFDNMETLERRNPNWRLGLKEREGAMGWEEVQTEVN